MFARSISHIPGAALRAIADRPYTIPFHFPHRRCGIAGDRRSPLHNPVTFPTSPVWYCGRSQIAPTQSRSISYTVGAALRAIRESPLHNPVPFPTPLVRYCGRSMITPTQSTACSVGANCVRPLYSPHRRCGIAGDRRSPLHNPVPFPISRCGIAGDS